jgi:hypothetical protein
MSRSSSTVAGERQKGANLGFEAKLWLAADKLRNNMDAAEYKHVVLGLIFLKYISDAFEEKPRQARRRGKATGADPEDPDEYRAENIFWVPKEARWSHLQARRQAAHHRQARRRRHGRHRARQPAPQGRAAQGLRPPRPRQAAPRPAHRPHQRHRPRHEGEPRSRTCSAASTSTSSPVRQRRGQERRPVLHAVLRGARAGRDARPLQGPRLRPLLRLRRHVRAAARSSSRPHGGKLGDISIYGQESTTPPGAWPR